jgi:hypothetical protein
MALYVDSAYLHDTIEVAQAVSLCHTACAVRDDAQSSKQVGR